MSPAPRNPGKPSGSSSGKFPSSSSGKFSASSSGRYSTPRSSGSHALPTPPGNSYNSRSVGEPNSNSSPRLAAQYNIEHDPLQSSTPVIGSLGEGLLQNSGRGLFSLDRLSIIILGLLVVTVLFFCGVYLATGSVRLHQLKDRTDRSNEAETQQQVQPLDD